MKTIIAGGRDLAQPELVAAAMWAESHGLPVKRFPANWKEHHKAAGPIRNREMAKYADALVAIWDGESKGTKSMIGLAEKARIEIHVHRVDSGGS